MIDRAADDRPESPGARVVAVPVVAVCRTDDHAVPWVVLRVPPEGGSIAIRCARHDALDAVDLGLAEGEACISLISSSALALERVEKILVFPSDVQLREPYPAQYPQRLRLSDSTAGALEDGHVVRLTARLQEICA